MTYFANILETACLTHVSVFMMFLKTCTVL